MRFSPDRSAYGFASSPLGHSRVHPIDVSKAVLGLCVQLPQGSIARHDEPPIHHTPSVAREEQESAIRRDLGCVFDP